MRAIDWTRVLITSAAIILIGLIVFGVIWLLTWVGQILLLVLLAGLLAITLMPLVDLLERPKYVPRPLAVVFAYACVFLVFAGIMYLVIPSLVQQANQLTQQLPQIVQQYLGPSSPIASTARRFGINFGGGSGGGNLGAQVQAVAQAVLSNVATIVKGISTFAVGFVVVIVLAFYLLNEGHYFRRKIDEIVPPEHRATFDFVQESVIDAVAGYVRAQLTVAFMVGVLAGFAAWLIGVRFPLIIGVLAGLLELIPFFGPTLGSIPAILIALFQGDWLRVVLIIAAFVIIQQIESNLVGPKIMAHGVGLHPFVVIVVVLVGIEVAGIWGALFAVPGMAILVAIGKRLYRLQRDRPRRVPNAA